MAVFRRLPVLDKLHQICSVLANVSMAVSCLLPDVGKVARNFRDEALLDTPTYLCSATGRTAGHGLSRWASWWRDSSGSVTLSTIDHVEMGRSRGRPAEWRNCCRALKHKRVAAFFSSHRTCRQVLGDFEHVARRYAAIVHSAECSPVCSETYHQPRSGCPCCSPSWKAWACWVLIVTAIVIALGSRRHISESAHT